MDQGRSYTPQGSQEPRSPMPAPPSHPAAPSRGLRSIPGPGAWEQLQTQRTWETDKVLSESGPTPGSRGARGGKGGFGGFALTLHYCSPRRLERENSASSSPPESGDSALQSHHRGHLKMSQLQNSSINGADRAVSTDAPTTQLAASQSSAVNADGAEAPRGPGGVRAKGWRCPDFTSSHPGIEPGPPKQPVGASE